MELFTRAHHPTSLGRDPKVVQVFEVHVLAAGLPRKKLNYFGLYDVKNLKIRIYAKNKRFYIRRSGALARRTVSGTAGCAIFQGDWYATEYPRPFCDQRDD